MRREGVEDWRRVLGTRYRAQGARYKEGRPRGLEDWRSTIQTP